MNTTWILNLTDSDGKIARQWRICTDETSDVTLDELAENVDEMLEIVSGDGGCTIES